MSDDIKFQEDYKYGFKDEDVSILKTDVGLNEDIVKEISRLKNEPEWMLEFRLKALRSFKAMPLPKFGPDLSYLDFDSYTYFTRPSKKEVQNWDEVPETIKNTFDRLRLVGSTTSPESLAPLVITKILWLFKYLFHNKFLG